MGGKKIPKINKTHKTLILSKMFEKNRLQSR